MKIIFSYQWVKSGEVHSRSFKDVNVYTTVRKYTERICKFDGCALTCQITRNKTTKEKSGAAQLWVCHAAAGVKSPTSEELAQRLARTRDSGVRELIIAIGSSDGFSRQDIESLQPNFLWSFGPLTLPHELAALVAAEQIYRAHTIIHKLPYHLGHGG